MNTVSVACFYIKDGLQLLEKFQIMGSHEISMFQFVLRHLVGKVTGNPLTVPAIETMSEVGFSVISTVQTKRIKAMIDSIPLDELFEELLLVVSASDVIKQAREDEVDAFQLTRFAGAAVEVFMQDVSRVVVRTVDLEQPREGKVDEEIREFMESYLEQEPIVLAHKRSIYHRDEIMTSEQCGCFNCLKIFRPEEITHWTDGDDTALCPHCGIDSVIGSESGYPITKTFLEQMQCHWFN